MSDQAWPKVETSRVLPLCELAAGDGGLLLLVQARFFLFIYSVTFAAC